MLSFPPFPSPQLHPFLCSSPLLWNLREYEIFKRAFSGCWQWCYELAAWILARPLLFGVVFSECPLQSGTSLSCVNSVPWGWSEVFSNQVSIFMLEVGQIIQGPSSDTSSLIFGRWQWLFSRTFTLRRIMHNFTLFYYLFDLNTDSLVTNK